MWCCYYYCCCLLISWMALVMCRNKGDRDREKSERERERENRQISNKPHIKANKIRKWSKQIETKKWILDYIDYYEVCVYVFALKESFPGENMRRWLFIGGFWINCQPTQFVSLKIIIVLFTVVHTLMSCLITIFNGRIELHANALLCDCRIHTNTHTHMWKLVILY